MFNPLDKSGFTFMMTTLWGKIKAIIPTKVSQLENDEKYIKESEVNGLSPTFVQENARENISSGEKLSVILGKISKWFSDLQPVAFSGKYSDLSEIPEYTPVESGLYKITVDRLGNISSVTPVKKEDIEELGIVVGYEFEVKNGSLYYRAKQGN